MAQANNPISTPIYSRGPLAAAEHHYANRLPLHHAIVKGKGEWEMKIMALVRITNANINMQHGVHVVDVLALCGHSMLWIAIEGKEQRSGERELK